MVWDPCGSHRQCGPLMIVRLWPVSWSSGTGRSFIFNGEKRDSRITLWTLTSMPGLCSVSVSSLLRSLRFNPDLGRLKVLLKLVARCFSACVQEVLASVALQERVQTKRSLVDGRPLGGHNKLFPFGARSELVQLGPDQGGASSQPHCASFLKKHPQRPSPAAMPVTNSSTPQHGQGARTVLFRRPDHGVLKPGQLHGGVGFQEGLLSFGAKKKTSPKSLLWIQADGQSIVSRPTSSPGSHSTKPAQQHF